MIDKYNCAFCNSNKVIKHGKTSSGLPRLRCCDCKKTWTFREDDFPRLELWKVTDFYLSGKSYRDLVKFYKSTPRRLNQKIRAYLEGFPSWEDYLDTYVSHHSSKVVFLTSKKFPCVWKCDGKHVKYLLLAIDMHSSLLLGYQIADSDNVESWTAFLNRLKERNITPNNFLTSGTGILLQATTNVFPDTPVKINFHKTYRDKELTCCLGRIQLDDKIINDALRVYSSFTNQNLLKIFELESISSLKHILTENHGLFKERLKNRLQNRLINRLDNFLVELQDRLDKFHLIRENPEPILNGLIARLMLVNAENGFSRISYYTQVPADANISDFSCGKMPRMLKVDVNSYKYINFIIEVLARSVELPIISNRCELKYHECIFI